MLRTPPYHAPTQPRNQNPQHPLGFRILLETLEIAMAARAYWKGSLRLSLVTCPVLLYPASTAVDSAAMEGWLVRH
jgi:hypothetical protein